MIVLQPKKEFLLNEGIRHTLWLTKTTQVSIYTYTFRNSKTTSVNNLTTKEIYHNFSIKKKGEHACFENVQNYIPNLIIMTRTIGKYTFPSI